MKNKETWTTQNEKWTTADMGGRVLEHLASGIYSEIAILREYIQNAADGIQELEEASGITNKEINRFSSKGKTLIIQDKGIGLDKDDLKSRKLPFHQKLVKTELDTRAWAYELVYVPAKD